MAWGGLEDMQGATEKSENIKGGHFDFNNLQGGVIILENHKPNIVSVTHCQSKITSKKLQA